ncbi:hypothetical protein BpHYR1_049472 [Brachionus plicatilis]|uniref:Uncharacterized protein n=1 Tax=Brachionus plicatilis TaxID=10195 RepID=A0A3M7RDS4_BRAPC|nr:hypothetical protein BpHYR1_049472 [Brachionus plicatilis]
MKFIHSMEVRQINEKLARTFLTVKLNLPLIFVLKISFCAERYEIVLNGYFLVLKRETQLFDSDFKFKRSKKSPKDFKDKEFLSFFYTDLSECFLRKKNLTRRLYSHLVKNRFYKLQQETRGARLDVPRYGSCLVFTYHNTKAIFNVIKAKLVFKAILRLSVD